MRPLSRLAAGSLSVGSVFLAAMLGSAAAARNISPWYESLAKPPLTPPNWVFGPVWTFLYILMAIALYRVLRSHRAAPGRGLAILLFALQLALNAGWSILFFGAQSPTLGLVVIVALEASLLATIYAFWRVDRMASFCLLPYALWVAFATYLNAGIWALNLT
ncbi:MAG: TspO/MBR family protein [Methylocystis sp.]